MNTIEALITIPRTISLNSTFDCNLSLYVISFDAPDETIPSYFVVGKITKFPDCFKNHAQIIFVELSDSLLHRVERDRCFVLIGRRIGRIRARFCARALDRDRTIGHRSETWPWRIRFRLLDRFITRADSRRLSLSVPEQIWFHSKNGSPKYDRCATPMDKASRVYNRTYVSACASDKSCSEVFLNGWRLYRRKKRFMSGIDWKDIYIYMMCFVGLDLENLYFFVERKVCYKKYVCFVTIESINGVING